MFVYLLMAKDGESFKIGKADDVWSRIDAIGGREAFDLPSSKACRLPSPKRALRVEKSLHRLFEAWRLPPGEKRREGDTEFFSMECHRRVLDLVSAAPDLFGVLESMPEPPARPACQAESRDAAKCRRETVFEEKMAKALSEVGDWIDARKRTSLLFSFIPPNMIVLVEPEPELRQENPAESMYFIRTGIPLPGGEGAFLTSATSIGSGGLRKILYRVCGLWGPDGTQEPLEGWWDRRIGDALARIPGFGTPDGLPGARAVLDEIDGDEAERNARVEDFLAKIGDGAVPMPWL